MTVFVRAKEQRIKSFCSPLKYFLPKSFVRWTECKNHINSKLKTKQDSLTKTINKIERLSSDQKHGTIIYKILSMSKKRKEKHYIKYIDKQSVHLLKCIANLLNLWYGECFDAWPVWMLDSTESDSFRQVLEAKNSVHLNRWSLQPQSEVKRSLLELEIWLGQSRLLMVSDPDKHIGFLNSVLTSIVYQCIQ